MSKQRKSTSKAPVKGNPVPKPKADGKAKRATTRKAARRKATLVEYLNEALDAARVPQVVIREPGRTFWPEPHGCVRGPEEDEKSFMQRVWAGAEPQKEMMLRNKHNATTVQARTDAELAIEKMGTPGEFQRLEQEMRYTEEDRRRAEAEAKALQRPEDVKDGQAPQPKAKVDIPDNTEWSRPMSKAEMMAALLFDSPKVFKTFAEYCGIRPAGNRQTWQLNMIRLTEEQKARLRAD